MEQNFRLDKAILQGKKVIVRVDFNVPLKEGKVMDDTRIRAAIPTIQKLREQGAKVILMSHLGRPKGKDVTLSLSQVLPRLSELIGAEASFCPSCVGEEAEAACEALKESEVLVLENLRFHSEETQGDEAFAKSLAALADVYVNDAFGTAHRAHASTAVIARYVEESLPGYLLETEVRNAQNVLENPKRPFTAIVGGAKVSSKISVLENLLPKVDNLIIGGGMAYTFMKAQGGDTGSSLVEDDYLEKARAVMQQAKEQGKKIYLPLDSVVADAFSNEANTKLSASDEVSDGWMGLDIGPKAIETFSKTIAESGTVLWNGPMGVFEMASFAEGTKALAKQVAAATQKHGAYSLIGGGDSVAAINAFGLAEKVSYISTGGGAMLELLEGKVLPGVAAVMD